MKLPQLSLTDKCMLNVPLKDGGFFFFILYYIFCMSAEFFFSIFDTVLFNCCNIFCRSKISDLASLGSSIVFQIVHVICLYTLSRMSISLNRKHFSVIQRVLDLSELDFIFHFYQSVVSIEFIYFVESVPTGNISKCFIFIEFKSS